MAEPCSRKYLLSRDLEAPCEACKAPIGDHAFALSLRDTMKMMDDVERLALEHFKGPRATGRVVGLDGGVSGMLLPWGANEQPALLGVPESDALYLPVFSSEAQLKEVMARAEAPYAKVKKIDDSDEFLSSIPLSIRIMIEPWFTPAGKLRWIELQR